MVPRWLGCITKISWKKNLRLAPEESQVPRVLITSLESDTKIFFSNSCNSFPFITTVLW